MVTSRFLVLYYNHHSLLLWVKILEDGYTYGSVVV